MDFEVERVPEVPTMGILILILILMVETMLKKKKCGLDSFQFSLINIAFCADTYIFIFIKPYGRAPSLLNELNFLRCHRMQCRLTLMYADDMLGLDSPHMYVCMYVA